MAVFSTSQNVQVGTWPEDGSPPSGVTTKIVRQTVVQKTNTVKRAKPLDLTIEYGTPLVHSGSDTVDAVISRRVVWVATPVRKYGTEITTCSMHRPLGGFSDPLEYETSMETIVRNKLLNKLRNQSINLANMLGEAKKTASLFVDLVTQVYKVTMAVKKRDPRILLYGYYNPYGKLRKGQTGYAWAADLPRDISKQWLKYVYGVKPLMKDMHDAMKELKEATDRSQLSVKVHASTSTQGALHRLTANSMWDSSIKTESTQTSHKHVSGVAFARLRNDILNTSLGAYGFTNPLGVAWELMPFSFVIDWWINVGEVIQSLDNALYIDTSSLACQLTTRYRQATSVDVLGQSGIYSRWTYFRGNPSGLPVIASFRFKTEPSLLHVANGTALLFSLLRR